MICSFSFVLYISLAIFASTSTEFAKSSLWLHRSEMYSSAFSCWKGWAMSMSKSLLFSNNYPVRGLPGCHRIPFQTTVNACGGSISAALRIGRACYVVLEQTMSKEAHNKVRQQWPAIGCCLVRWTESLFVCLVCLSYIYNLILVGHKGVFPTSSLKYFSITGISSTNRVMKDLQMMRLGSTREHTCLLVNSKPHGT